MKISEINLTPIKPKNGHVAFASIVIDDSLYLGSIGVHVRNDGTYRLLYPTKNSGTGKWQNVYYPISRDASYQIESAILEKCREIFERSDDHDRHDKACDDTRQASLFKS